MPPKLRTRLSLVRDICFAALATGAALLFSIGEISPRLMRADVTSTVARGQSDPVALEPIGEEADMFKERARERIRQQRRESKQRSKEQTPPTFKSFFSLTPADPREVSDGVGAIGRVGHLYGKTFGRNDSITPVEVMPYVLTDEHFFFVDARGFASNRSQLGGNFGLGYRYLRDDLNGWSGASVWYDSDKTSGRQFQQIGLSFETLISQFEWRSNVYLPITSSQTFSNLINGERFVGNQLLYGQAVDQGTALRGIDTEIGGSVPIRDRHQIRGFVGGYHFEGGSSGGINGFKARVEGVFNNGVTGQVLYTNDHLYGSNVMVGCSLQLPFGSNHPSSGWHNRTPSPFRYVERNYNVIVSHHVTTTNDKVAINPLTGNPYIVDQVQQSGNLPGVANNNSQVIGGATPDGTTANPFRTIADAQAAGGDLIYVRSGSVINQTVTMAEGQHLLGQIDGVNQSVALGGGGYATLPNVPHAGNSSATPVFASVNGPAVVLASNTDVGGFVFNTTTGGGVTGTNASGVSLHDLTFSNIGADAVHLTGSSGTVTLRNLQVNSATGNGIVVDGGNANVSYFGLGNTITASGNGFILENTTGGSIVLNNLSVKDTGLDGLVINNVSTDVTIASLNATNTTGPSVFIAGSTGVTSNVNGTPKTTYNTYNFTGFTNIVSPAAAGFSVNGTDALIDVSNLSVTSTAASPAVSLVSASSEILIGNVNLVTTNATGLYGRTLDLLQINGGEITTLHGSAVDIAYSTINTSFSDISVNGGPFGISLAQSTGSFAITGNGQYGSGGTIQNIVGTNSAGLLINSFGSTSIGSVDFTNNSVGVNSTLSSSLALGGVRINGSSGYAIQSNNDTAITVANSIFGTNGALGGGTILVGADTAANVTAIIQNNSITDTHGTAIQFQTATGGANASLTSSIVSNSISASYGGSPVISVLWNGPVGTNISNNTINAYGSGMTGIFVNETSATSSLTTSVNSNTITFGGNQSTGVSILATGQSFNQLNYNTINFNSASGTGLHFGFASTSSDSIIGNVITDSAGGATGMLFDTVAANSSIRFDSNIISLLSTDNTTHRGIIFTNVTPTIQFQGSQNNLIYNTTTPQTTFQIPINAATGGFFINGVLE